MEKIMPISVFATISPKAAHFSDARQAIRDIVDETRGEEGCISFDLHEDVEAGRLHLYEVWADRAAFDTHHAQPYTQAVFRKYTAWLAAPVDLLFMRPAA
jgi:quinol monooxygenase YgiN